MKKYKITACVNGVKKSRIVKVKNEVDAYLIARGLSAVIDEDIDMFNELLADSKSTQKSIDFWRDRRFRKQAEAEKRGAGR